VTWSEEDDDVRTVAGGGATATLTSGFSSSDEENSRSLRLALCFEALSAAAAEDEVEAAALDAVAFFFPFAAALVDVAEPAFFAAADALVPAALPLAEAESANVELEELVVPSSAGLAGGNGLADRLPLPRPSPSPCEADGPRDECG
jgi:hypothetical protein